MAEISIHHAAIASYVEGGFHIEPRQTRTEFAPSFIFPHTHDFLNIQVIDFRSSIF